MKNVIATFGKQSPVIWKFANEKEIATPPEKHW